MRVSVVGGGTITDAEYEQARDVGRLLAQRGHTVVCGGRTGVMEAVCRGAREEGGETIGVLPGEDSRAANEYVTTPIATGLGNARNVLVVLNGDAAIAIDGSTGTLSEIAHALDLGRPVAGLGTHDVAGVEAAESAAEAVEYVEASV
ncbi:TIGR00725 family protein [Natronoarchaeum mannanilyticum]|uniref:TIGR00725 family protein n=1 Tax=Natronoarchaeum mannanilyticum TaxID=926360 RepID=A0AAV3T8R1_9EURY